MIERADEVVGDVGAVDVCVVGGGAAGITVALSLMDSGASVVLLESGGFDFDAPTATLYRGDNAGLPLRFGNAEMSLDTVRLRYLGGSTNHWTGMCHPLDDHDFLGRSHLPWSGWPMDKSTLDPYYARAQQTCELGTRGWDPVDWFGEAYRVSPRADTTGVRPVVYRFSPPTRFGERYRGDLGASSTTRVLLGANVVEVVESGGRVGSIRVRTLAGNAFSVHAEHFVLATGGLEVPRLLLASTGNSPVGVGNENDLVGRTFMEHPHFVCGRMILAGTREERAPYEVQRWGDTDQWRTWAGFALDPDVQEAAGVGNATVFGWKDGGSQAGAASEVGSSMQAATSVFTGREGAAYTTFVRTESRPDPESRVTLSDDRDALGMRRIRLDWRIGDFEWDTARITLEHLASSLGETGMGRLEVDPGGENFRSRVTLGVGNHHMGTARMSASPADGVVDADCRVHTSDNLYVAGSAVFPTSGAANPTLTIVALAHRLSDHLAARS